MDKVKAAQTIVGIYNTLQAIPVSGEQQVSMMAGIFQALKELGQWVNEVKEDGDKDDKCN
jgi:hypothetical protein